MGAELEGVASLNEALDDIADRWTGTKVVYIVGSDLDYSAAVEFGTQPHPISGDPLAFTVDGETVFAQTVDHPGTDPQPYLRPALEAVERQLAALADSSDSLEEFVKKAAFAVEAEAKKRAPVDDGDLKDSIEARQVS